MDHAYFDCALIDSAPRHWRQPPTERVMAIDAHNSTRGLALLRPLRVAQEIVKQASFDILLDQMEAVLRARERRRRRGSDGQCNERERVLPQ